MKKSEADKLQAKVNAKGGALGGLGSTLGHEVMDKATKPKKVAKKPRIEAKELTWMKVRLMKCRRNLSFEYQFAKPRKFRFDIALPKEMIAIEYEGINSSKSRHTTITGYTKDCEKYNLATMNGWKVFRYTALNYKEVEKLIEFYYGK